MTRAQPSRDLFEKVTSGLNAQGVRFKIISFPIKKWAAAAILLLALNIGSVIYYTSQNTKKQGYKYYQSDRR